MWVKLHFAWALLACLKGDLRHWYAHDPFRSGQREGEQGRQHAGTRTRQKRHDVISKLGMQEAAYHATRSHAYGRNHKERA